MKTKKRPPMLKAMDRYRYVIAKEPEDYERYVALGYKTVGLMMCIPKQGQERRAKTALKRLSAIERRILESQ